MHGLPNPSFHRTWIEIDLGAMRHNVGLLRSQTRADGAVMAVVKANGYGLGAVACAKAVWDEVEAVGVACVIEAAELAAAGLLQKPIYLLSPVLAEEREMAVQNGWVIGVSSLEEAMAISAIASAQGKVAAIFIVVDIGMGRIGILTDDLPSAYATIQDIAALPFLRMESLLGHFPSADEDQAATLAQSARFAELRNQLEAAGFTSAWWQVANSAGALGFPRNGPREMIRTGIALYGASPLEAFSAQIRPVIAWKARITQLRTLPVGWGVSYGSTYRCTQPTRVATLAVGYADGVPRHLSNAGASVLIHGKRCPVLGRVTMDQIMVDVSLLEASETPARSGDAAVLIGKQGDAEITLNEFAKWAGTISYEIICHLGPRVERVYVA